MGGTKTSDFNKTEKVGKQGPLAQTLAAYEEWDVNKMQDPVAYGDAKIAGKGSK